MKTKKSGIGAGLIVLSSLFYASYGVWATLMGDFFGGYTASAMRSVLVLIILLPVAFFRHKLVPLELRKNWKTLAAMTLVSTLIWGLLYYSVLNAGVGVSATVNYAAIVMGMVFFGWLLAAEKITASKKWSMAIGMFGLALIFIQTYTGTIAVLSLIAAVVSGLAVAANTVIAKQLPYNATQATCVLWGTSVIANLPMVFLLSEPLPPIGLHVEWLFLLIFAIASIFSSLTLMYGLKYIEAGLAGIIGLLEIVFGIIFGVILFSETIPPLTLLGAGIILFAAAFPYLHDLYISKAKKAPAL